MFGVLYAAPESAPDVVAAVAREFSPRVERYGPVEIAIDLHGVARLFGDAAEIGRELRRTAADRGLRVRVAIAATRTTARLVVRHRAGVTVVQPGSDAAVLAPLPLALLNSLARPDAAATTSDPDAPDGSLVPTLRRWGLRTLGEFAALAPDAVAARLGQAGVFWQRVACGEDARPLVPTAVEERFEESLDLEWPIEGLEPLSFVLGRLMDPLSAHLERRDRGAAVLHVRLHLVTRTVHERSLQLPVPMRDPRTLRTLVLLDLESHPPSAAIDRVTVAVDPTPGRVVQFSLLTRPIPSPEQISTLMARLTALMGEGRCGSPATVDSWQPGAFAMTTFAPVDVSDGARSPALPPVGRVETTDSRSDEPRTHRHTDSKKDRCDSVPLWPVAVTDAASPVVALRRFRVPVPARVRIEQGKPARVTTDRRGLAGGRVDTCAGPWRTSGAWWVDGPPVAAPRSGARADERATPGAGSSAAWDGDEWDVTLTDGATYRLFRERLRADTGAAAPDGRWFIAGILD